MSREFRHVPSGYFHSVLGDAAEQPGRHEISKALALIYQALAPIERACAGFEAADNGSSYPTLKLQAEWSTISAAVAVLAGIHRRDQELIADLMRDRERMPAIPDLPLRRPPPAHDD